MVKTKQKQHVGSSANGYNTSRDIIGSSDFNNDPDNDLEADSSWVIVKKQRVTILVPLSPVADRNQVTTHQEPSEQQSLPTMEAVNVKNKGEHVRNGSSVRNIPVSSKLMRQDYQNESGDQKQIHTSNSNKILAVSRSSKPIMQTRLLIPCQMPRDQRLRALNFGRKVEKAGGLSIWLASKGLGQFVRIFRRKGLHKFQLLNLTMKRLKDMGVNAVGPRRKLLHAIDCICQPDCFRPSKYI